MLKFPYGISDFAKIRTNHYFYVDRTHLIPTIEDAGDQLLFLRPRRFGKSLLLSMLENYYDVAKADQFDKLFGQLAIGKNPTPKHHQYFVLKWDFSAVKPEGETADIERTLFDHLNNCIKAFAKYYRPLLSEEIEIDRRNAMYSFESLLTAVRQTPYKLYLLIDEYDNFANELMMEPANVSFSRDAALRAGESALKAVLKVVKAASSGGGLDRVFLTGISPIILTDLTSGYNVAVNIYLDSEFNDLCGFTESEIMAILTQIGQECHWPLERVAEAMSTMRQFYNGYRFSEESQELVYNPTMALYFFRHLQPKCQAPAEMLDSNLEMDRNKLAYISTLPHGLTLLTQLVANPTAVTVSRLVQRFGVERILNAKPDTAFLASLLYYFGVLTQAGRNEFGELILTIPNLVVRKLYVEQLLERFLPDQADDVTQLAQSFYRQGDLQPVCEFVEQRYFKVLDNRDSISASELAVKMAFLTLLFNDQWYLMDSETALERGYADLTMIIRSTMRQYRIWDFLFEFKFVTLKQLTLPDGNKLTGEALKQMPVAELKICCQPQLTAAREQLQRYRQTLMSTYGEKLRLKVFAVVAVGWERVIWEEIH